MQSFRTSCAGYGSFGLILTAIFVAYHLALQAIMFKAMNRSLTNVIMGGMGTKTQGKGKAKAIEGTATEATSQQVK